MGNHSVRKAGNNFEVTDKDGNVLHSFPSEGEANLQVQYLDEQAKEQAKEAKQQEKPAAKDDEADDKRHAASGRAHR